MGSGRKGLFSSDDFFHQRSQYLTLTMSYFQGLSKLCAVSLGRIAGFFSPRTSCLILEALLCPSSLGIWGAVQEQKLCPSSAGAFLLIGVFPLYLFGIESKFCFLDSSSGCHKEDVSVCHFTLEA